MSPDWKAKPPSDDAGYLDRLSRSLFTAGLSWGMVEKKWPNFRKSFQGFDVKVVAKFGERDVTRLMKDTGIVRNERKVRATIYNAKQFLLIREEHGSFRKYLDSFAKDEKAALDAISERFQHVGPSTARMFMWSVAYPLTPTAEEKKWLSGHNA